MNRFFVFFVLRIRPVLCSVKYLPKQKSTRKKLFAGNKIRLFSFASTLRQLRNCLHSFNFHLMVLAMYSCVMRLKIAVCNKDIYFGLHTTFSKMPSHVTVMCCIFCSFLYTEFFLFLGRNIQLS